MILFATLIYALTIADDGNLQLLQYLMLKLCAVFFCLIRKKIHLVCRQLNDSSFYTCVLYLHRILGTSFLMRRGFFYDSRHGNCVKDHINAEHANWKGYRDGQVGPGVHINVQVFLPESIFFLKVVIPIRISGSRNSWTHSVHVHVSTSLTYIQPQSGNPDRYIFDELSGWPRGDFSSLSCWRIRDGWEWLQCILAEWPMWGGAWGPGGCCKTWNQFGNENHTHSLPLDYLIYWMHRTSQSHYQEPHK